LIQLYNIFEEKINSSFEYMIMRFSNTCDEYILRLLYQEYIFDKYILRLLYYIKDIFFVEENYYLKKEK